MLEGRDQLQFGIPKKRREKEEDPYKGTPVLRMKPAPENKGETYKFELNDDALELLNLKRENAEDVKTVSFSFIEDDNTIYIGNTTSLSEVEDQYKYNVSMSGVFSNSMAHKYISTLLDINENEENIFELLIEDILNIKIAKLQLINKDNKIEDIQKEMENIDLTDQSNVEVIEEL